MNPFRKPLLSLLPLFLLISCNQAPAPSTEQSIYPQTFTKPYSASIPDTTNDEEAEAYFRYDTLLIREYISTYGHHIRLEGGQAHDIFRISVTTKNGLKKKFQIAEKGDWYGAAHASVLWDNEDYIFVYHGCGAPCWWGEVLPLKEGLPVRSYDFFVYENMQDNVIIYPDTNFKYDNWILENFDTGIKHKIPLDICRKTVTPVLTIDTIYEKREDVYLIRYKDATCEQFSEKEVKL